MKIKKELFYVSLLLLLLSGFLFRQVLFEGYLFLGGDALSPKAVRQGIESSMSETGEYSLWLPWMFSGLPSLHSFQNISQFYFPHVIIKGLMSIGVDRFWDFIFHFIFAGMGMFLLLKRLKLHTLSACFGAVSYMLMPYLITMIVHGHGSQMMTTAYIPWVFFVLHRLKSTSNLSNTGLLALILGLQLQRAHVQIAYYTWMMVGLYLLYEMVHTYKTEKKLIPKHVLFAFPACMLAIAMSMWIYLPAMSYTPFSIRGMGGGGGTGLEYATQWSFSLGEMLTFLIPSFYGFGGATYWGSMPFTDYPNYMGIIVFFFAIVGMLNYKDRFRQFLIIASIFSLFISFGHHFSAFYSLFYDYFPFFNKFRVPVMILVLLQFNAVVLASLGIHDVILRKVNRKTVYGILGGILFTIIALNFSFESLVDFGKRSHPVLNTLRGELVSTDVFRISIFLGLILASLYGFFTKVIKNEILLYILIVMGIVDVGIVSQQIINPKPESYRYTTLKKREFLKAYLQEDSVIRFLKSDSSKFRILPLKNLMNSNRWTAFQLESVSGYHPAKLGNYNTFMQEVGLMHVGAMDMLNIKYLISLEKMEHPLLLPVHEGSLFHVDKYEQAYVYEYKYWKERLFFAKNIELVNVDQVVEKLKLASFSPMEMAYIVEDVGEIQFDANAHAEIVKWEPDKITFKTSVDSPQLLIISEIFYPEGWEIVDSPNIDIIQVNHILRGVVVPTGTHQFTMAFNPTDVQNGSIITWLSLLFILGMIFSPFIRKK